MASFAPDVVVVICGADALRGDPRGGLDLSVTDMWECVRVLRDYNKQMLVLGRHFEVLYARILSKALLFNAGGGGYNFTAVSRCWTFLTAMLVGDEVDQQLPEHEFFELYGPSWTLF